MSDTLRFKVEQLPAHPGVYIMRDLEGTVIYVGKALNLRNRVRSYFRHLYQDSPEDFILRNLDLKTQFLAQRIDDFETIVTDTETEALVLEAILIKQFKPRFNVRLKDDKRYPYLMVTLSEPFPRIFVTRKTTVARVPDRLFGPYTDVRYVRNLLENLHKLFKIRSCRLKLPEQKLQRPCMEYSIGRCGAPCTDFISREEYREMMDSLVLFLEGKVDRIRETVEGKMKEASASWNFERAAQYRDLLQGLEVIQASQKIDLKSSVDSDIISQHREGGESCFVRFQLRNGRLVDRSHFFFSGSQVPADNDSDFWEAFIRDIYLQASHYDFPEYIVCQQPLQNSEAVSHILSQRSARGVTVLHLGESSNVGEPALSYGEQNHLERFRSEWSGLLNLAAKNARLVFQEEQNHKEFQDKRRSLVEIETMLRLPVYPDFMVCFDISHFQGSHNIASVVAFKEGKADPSRYRRMRIRSVQDKADDYSSMHEAVARYLSRLLAEDKALPGLLLIDGGKGQLNAALQAAQDLGLREALSFAALAKREEEIYVPDQAEPLLWPPTSRGLLVLRRLRDEAHRFAVSYHRLLRARARLRSAFDEVEGIGPVLRKRIFQAVAAAKDPSILSRSDFEKIKGIGKDQADRIYRILSERQEDVQK